eukprot:411078_1
MSINKPKIGNQIEFWYHKKFQKGEIIDKTKTNITIKIWTSILNPKIITMNYPTEWKNQIKKNTITKYKNKIFPSWVKISTLCVLYGSNTPWYQHSSRIICKISKCKDGKNISLLYIKYPTNSHDTHNEILTLKTLNINLSNQKISPELSYITFIDKYGKNKILYPYVSQIEIDNDYDIINNISNNQLIKKILKTTSNKSNIKSTQQQIIINHNKCFDNCEYITTSKLQYGIILQCKTFPFDINRLLISFLAQRMIYICPPTPCNKIQNIAQSWQFSKKSNTLLEKGYDMLGYELSVIGVEFEMNRDLIISGFELNNIEMLGRYKHTIYLNSVGEAIQLQLFQQLRNAQFIFKHNKLIKLKNGHKYFVQIKVNANVPCYQCHEPPSNIKGFINNNQNTLYLWKCFRYITWKKFNTPDVYEPATCRLEWFPHFAFLLP